MSGEARARFGHHLAGVRLDSGDILADSIYCRQALDEAGVTDVRIVASGDMDEFRIAELEAAGAPIDAYGVGTALAVGAGSIEHGISGGALGGVYKLVWYDADAAVRPMRRNADQGGRSEEHLAGQETGLADRSVSRGRDPSRR